MGCSAVSGGGLGGCENFYFYLFLLFGVSVGSAVG